MYKTACALATAALVVSCQTGDGDAPAMDLRPVAQDFFTGVFGCDAALLEETAADDVVISYPIFETLFDTPSLRGLEAVREFSAGFCNRWQDPQIMIHEALQDGDRVVLVWGFSALQQGSELAESASAPRESWGGISFFRFDDAGRVVEELGEESTPGPVARLNR